MIPPISKLSPRPPTRVADRTDLPEPTAKRKAERQAGRLPAGLDIDPERYDDDDFSCIVDAPATLPDHGSRKVRQWIRAQSRLQPGADGLGPRQQVFSCSRRSWPLLLGFFSLRYPNYRDFRQGLSAPATTVHQFAKMLHACGAAADVPGMPLIHAQHPAVREELLRIHRLLVPETRRTPLPEQPESLPAGHDSFVNFLASQPPCEWFDLETDIVRRFDCGHSSGWVRTCLDRATARGWLERDPEHGSRYRLDDGYRLGIADLAAGVPWAALFPDLPVPPCATGPRTPITPIAPIGPIASPLQAPPPLPPRRPLPKLADHLVSRGVAVQAPSRVAVVRDFLDSRGWGYASPCTYSPLTTADALLRVLAGQQRSRAVLCMPGSPAYLEAWTDARGVWRARSLLEPLPSLTEDGAVGDSDVEDLHSPAPVARHPRLQAVLERQLAGLRGPAAGQAIGLLTLD